MATTSDLQSLDQQSQSNIRLTQTPTQAILTRNFPYALALFIFLFVAASPFLKNHNKISNQNDFGNEIKEKWNKNNFMLEPWNGMKRSWGEEEDNKNLKFNSPIL